MQKFRYFRANQKNGQNPKGTFLRFFLGAWSLGFELQGVDGNLHFVPVCDIFTCVVPFLLELVHMF